ncbi:hypothetical protein [Oscillatoria acuminata]|uniref:Uncharacterized protein n=1 Tax=Oscillatoria acuminata PCC 6304 TaxID=56110 RepID=K9TDF3_9CYAN|nr:hypothetical protein [Oscillatoria acuminata]AFY80161.1 hypothetical protein Oscil6304_0411 [Oscillatoria acuminata PCC 6304]
MKIISLLTGEQSGGISPHASTHHPGGTDALSAEAIGAEMEGAADAAIIAHLAAANPHPQYSGGGSGGAITYNVIRSSSAFVEEFDDFLSQSAFNKLGWTITTGNATGTAEPGNKFSGAHGVFNLTINGVGQAVGNWAHLRLGNFPVRPLVSEGYSNIEISAIVGLDATHQTANGWTSRFGLLDTGAGSGINSSILISAEYFSGEYNWVAIYKSGIGGIWQVIAPITDLATNLFNLKIFIDCENSKIIFTVNDSNYEANIAPSDWLFGAMAPIFVIQRAAVSADTINRSFYIDKYLFRKNVSQDLPADPAADIAWDDILNKPDFIQESTPVTLTNYSSGWSARAGEVPTARKIGNIVYMAGSATRVVGSGNNTILTLPDEFRPSIDLFILASGFEASNYKPFHLIISPSGEIWFSNPNTFTNQIPRVSLSFSFVAA